MANIMEWVDSFKKDGYSEANADIILHNSSRIAIREAQTALKDLKISEEEILRDVMDLRYRKGE